MKRKILALVCAILMGLTFLIPATAALGTASANLINSAALTPISTGYTPLDQLVSSILSSRLSSASSAYEKVRMCYDYVITGASYQTATPAGSIYTEIERECNYVKSADMYIAARAYNFLVNKRGTCIDFADAFLVLMRAVGLECYLMHGTYDSGPHYWNLIRLNGSYYVFDTEVDWAVSGRNGSTGSYDSFCLPTSSDTHRRCDQSACIAEFGNFQCRNKTNTPGVTVPGTQTPVTSGYTTGTYRLDDAMNFRSGHSTSASIYSVLPAGITVTVTEVYNEWGKITYNGATGWISLEYSTCLSANQPSEPVTQRPVVTTPAEPAVAPDAPYTASYTAGAYYTNDVMNFRSDHNGSASVISIIPAGTQLIITEVYGIWGKTTYNGRTGWMSLEYSTYLGSNAPQKNVPAQSTATGNGDADGDGDITAGDARLILRHSVSLELINAANQNRADVNGDGRITPEDARIVLRKAVHIE